MDKGIEIKENTQAGGRKGYLMPAFIGFIALLAAIAVIFMLIMPQDAVKYTAGNTYGNIMNGGRILKAGGYIFYGSDDKGLLKIPVSEEASVKETEVIGESGAYNLSEVNSKIYYELSSGLKCFDFISTQDIFSQKSPQVIGSWIYYINDQGNISKMRMESGKEKDLGLACDGSFYVENSRIYYKDVDGCVYSAALDGSDRKKLIEDDIIDFFLKDEFLYYKTSDTIYAFMIYDKETTIITSIDSPNAPFNIFGYYLIYSSGGIKAIDLSSSNINRKVVEISTMNASEIYTTDSSAYIVTDKGELYSINSIPSEPKLVDLGL